MNSRMKYVFLGGAGEVGGSCMLLSAGIGMYCLIAVSV